MDFSIDMDVFHYKMSALFQDRVLICLYMDNLVITINYTLENHIDILYEILTILEKPGIQTNTVKFE